MGVIEFKEINWDLDSIRANPVIRKTEIFIWAIFLIGALILITVFTSVGDMFLTQQQLLNRYTPPYPWLNRCDLDCIENIDTGYLNLQSHCSGLRALYSESQHSNLYDWRLAIDDRATSLSCEGFPKTLDTIATETNESLINNRRELNASQREKVKKLEDYIAHETLRFEQSLQAGDLTHLVYRFYQDLRDRDTMVITVTDEWSGQTLQMQRQVAQAIWQKWAAIHSPLEFERADIRLITIAGDIIGGSAGGEVWME